MQNQGLKRNLKRIMLVSAAILLVMAVALGVFLKNQAKLFNVDPINVTVLDISDMSSSDKKDTDVDEENSKEGEEQATKETTKIAGQKTVKTNVKVGNINYANKNNTITLQLNGIDETKYGSSSLTANDITVKVGGENVSATKTIINGPVALTDGTSGVSYTLQLTNVQGDGELSIIVKSGTLYDEAGNTNQEVPSNFDTQVIIDNTAPTKPTYTATFVDGSGTYTSGTWTSKQVQTAVQSTENGSGVDKFQYSINGGTWTNCGRGTSFSSEGVYQSGDGWTFRDGRNDKVRFRAIDNVGNISEVSDEFNVRYDNSAPTLSLSKETYQEGFDGWTLPEGASIDGDGVLTMSQNGTAISKMYKTDGEKWYPEYEALTTASASNFSPKGGIHNGLNYYNSTLGSAGANGVAFPAVLNTWTSSLTDSRYSNPYLGMGGDIKYVDIYILAGTTYSQPPVKIRNFKLHGQLYSSFYDITVTSNGTNSNIAKTKWLAGEKTVADFASAGEKVENNTFRVTENGTYTVYVEDEAGNGAVSTIVVDKIDKTAPTIEASTEVEGTTTNITFKDNLSGVTGWQITNSSTAPTSGWTNIAVPSNVTTGSQVTATGLTPGTHYIWAIDAAGNKTSKEINVHYKVTYSKGTHVSAIGSTGENNTTGTITLPTITPDTGYNVLGWYNGDTKFGNPGETKTITGNISLTAKAEAATYTITADANGGSISSTTGWTGTGASATKSVTYDSAYGDLSTPTRTGYTFNGWGNGIQVIGKTKNAWVAPLTDNNFVKNNLKANTAYKVEYDITLNEAIPSGYSASQTSQWGNLGFRTGTSSYSYQMVAGGTLHDKSGSNYEVGKKYHITATTTTPSDLSSAILVFYTARSTNSGGAGYVINGTFSNIVFYETSYNYGMVTKDTTNKIASNHTIKANWTANNYNISFNGNGATAGNTASFATTYDENTTLPANGYTRAYTVTYNYNNATGGNSTPNATATYTFAGWKNNNTGDLIANRATVKNLATSGTTTLYAQWNSGSVTLPTPTRTGYTFGGWYTDSGLTTSAGAAGASYTPTAVTTLYAKWTVNQYTVTYKDIFVDSSNAAHGDPLGTTTKKKDYGTTVNATELGTDAALSKYYSYYQYKGTSGDATVPANDDLVVYRYFWAWQNINVNNPEGTEKYDGSVAKFSVSYNGGTYSTNQTDQSSPSCIIPYGGTIRIKDIAMQQLYYELNNVTWAGSALTATDGVYTATVTGVAQNLYINTKYKIFTITLDSQSATSTNHTKTIYEKYNTGYYTNSTATTQMTTSANGITVPTRTGYTFGGYYTETNGGGTQYIDANGKLTSSASTTNFSANGTLYAKWTANTATITIKKDNSNWSNSGINVALYDGTTAKYAYSTGTASGATVTFTTVESKTYNVYASRTKAGVTVLADTGVDITVTSTGTATIDYYTLTRSIGKGSTLATKLDSSSGTAITADTQVLKNTAIYVEAGASTGYNTPVAKVNNTAITNKTNTTITAATTIASSATANELTFNNQTKTATYSTSAQTATIDGAGNGTGTYTYTEKSEKNASGTDTNYISISGTTVTLAAKTPAGTYTYVVTARDSNSEKTKDATITITVNKAKITIPSSPAAKTYNGQAQASGITTPANTSIVETPELINNGNGSYGNNTNFSNWTYNASNSYNGSNGSFSRSGGYAIPATDEYFALSTQDATYTLSLDAKTANGTSSYYAQIMAYDIDKNKMYASHYMFVNGSTTTLAQDLKKGDKVIYLTNLSGWNKSLTQTYQKGLIVWNYTNSQGFTYPAETYSRNVYTNLYDDGNSAVDVNAGTITLDATRFPNGWTGSTTIPAGTAVSQSSSGNSYKYIGLVNTIVPTTWTHYTGSLTGTDYSGANATKFPPYAVYGKVGFVWNTNSESDTGYITNVSVTGKSVTSATNVGTYSIAYKIDDTANYEWSDGTTTIKTIPWIINPYDITSNSTVGAIANQTYNGTAKTPNPTVTALSKTLTNGTDYSLTYKNNTNAGTATVYIVGKGNFKGSKTTTFTINKATNTLTVSAKTGLTYNTTAQSLVTPANAQGTVYYSTTNELTSSNYTNTSISSTTIPTKTDAGTYTVYWYTPGNGNYGEKKDSVSVTIGQFDISSGSIANIANQNYTGSEIKPTPAVSVTINGASKTLTVTTEYTYGYSSNTNPGASATVTATGTGNYKGSVSKTFTINPRVTFNNNNGSGTMSNQNVTYNTNTTLTANTFTRNGYTFAGWNTAANGSGTAYANSATVKLTANTTLYAQWTEKTYSLQINPNGGSLDNSTSTVTRNLKYSDVSNITTPTRTGYTFAGWSELSSAAYTNGLASMTTYKWSGDVTITSQAKSADNPITGMSNEMKLVNSGSSSSSPGLGGFYHGKTAVLNAKYVHVFVAKLPQGYYFHNANNSLGNGGSTQWLTSNEGTGSWKTYVYQVNAGSSGTPSTFGHVYVSADRTNAWGVARAETGSYTAYIAYSNIFDITSNNTGIGQYDGTGVLTANWTANKYHVTLNNQSATTAGTTDAWYYYNTVNNGTYYYSDEACTTALSSGYNITKPTKTGYTFGGYYTETNGGGTQYVNAGGSFVNNVYQTAHDRTLYAKWTAITYAVAYNGNGNTGGSTASSSHTYDVAKNLTANGYTRAYTVTYNYNNATGGNGTTSATATYTFAGWATSDSGDKVYDNSQSVTNLSSTNGATVTLYAKWNSASVTLPTPTRTGYTFGGWYTDSDLTQSAGAAGASYTPTAATNLYAKWTPVTYTVVYNGNGNTGGSTASSSHTYDTAKTLTANGFTKTGYTFAGWATSATGAVAYSNSQSVSNLSSTNGATVNLYAKWTPVQYTITLNNQSATTAGTASVTSTYDAVLPNITVPAKTGYTFKGYYSNTTAFDLVTSVGNLTTTSKRINFTNSVSSVNGWAMTSTDAETHIQGKIKVTDSTLTTAPTLEFNDVAITARSAIKSGNDWIIYVDFDITEQMVSARGSTAYDTTYRFIDVNGLTSSSTVTVEYLTKGGKKYYNNSGTGVYPSDFTAAGTIYARWVDETKPSAPTWTAKHTSDNSAYTSGDWTNNEVYTTISSTDSGSGIKEIQYSYDKSTWTKFAFGKSALTQSGTTWTGSEQWGVTNGRDATVYFRAIDNAGNVSDNSTAFTIRYDTALPTVTLSPNGQEYTVSTTSTNVSTTVTAADTGGSTLNLLQYAWSTSNTTEPTSWTNFTNGTAISASKNGGVHYLWLNITDKAGNRCATKVSSAFTVNTPPVITSNPTDVTVQTGTNATFSTTVTNGYPTSNTYQWQKQTNLQAGGSGSTATKGTDDGGNYFTKTTSDTWTGGVQLPSTTVTAGKTYTWCMEVKSSIAITNRFDANCTAGGYTGNDAAMSSAVTGGPSTIPANTWTKVWLTVTVKSDATNPYLHHTFCPTVSADAKVYYRNLTLTEESAWSNISGATSNSYTVSAPTTDADNTVYRCVVSNTKNTVKTTPAILNVLGKPTVSLKLNSSSGSAYTSGSWTKENVFHTITTSGESIAKYQYSHNNSTWTDIPSTWTLTKSDNTATYIINWAGQWNFYIRGVDYSGNVTPSSDMFTVSIEKTAPTVSAYAGTMLYTDPTFASGVNDTHLYDNYSSGKTTITRTAGTTPEGNYYLKIVNTGTGTNPGLGGFYFGHYSAANKVYVTRIVAKIPVGYTLNWHSNATGDNRTNTWLTDTAGTGDWEEYINVLTCGSTGTFSTTSFFAIYGTAGTASAPVEWDVAYATVFDTTKWAKEQYVVSGAKDTSTKKITGYGMNQSNSTEPTYTTLTEKQNYGKAEKITANGTYYAWYKDALGNADKAAATASYVDTTGPTFTSAEIKNITPTGYDVYIYGVTDNNGSGVNRVQFPTWTDNAGQDDIQSSWSTNTAAKGTLQSDGTTWVYHVNTTDHKNEAGKYYTYIYLYDNLGNSRSTSTTNSGAVTVPTVTATFNSNGGTTASPATIEKAYNNALGTLPTTSRTGYTFAGWWTAASGGTQISDSTTMPATAPTYYTHWTPITYTVAYNGNGYTGGSTASSSHTYDVAKNLTANGFTRAYTVTYNYNNATGGNGTTSATATYTFAGWATTASGNKAYNNSQSVTNLSSTNGATVTLYAKWNSGSVTLPTPTKTGNTFGGWYTDSGLTTSAGAAGASYTPTATTNLYAKWTVNNYTVNFNGNGGSNGTAITKAYGTALGTLPTSSRTGYRFDGWYTAASGGTQITESTTMPLNGATYYAHWTQYAFSVTSSGTTTYYMEYADARTAATAGSTITLLKDYTRTSSSIVGTGLKDGCTLDLGSYTLTMNAGMLQGNDLTITGSGTLNCVNSELEISSGTVTLTGSASIVSSGSVAIGLWGGEFIMQSGTVKTTASGYPAIAPDRDSTVTISGGTVIGCSHYGIAGWVTDLNDEQYRGTVTVTGGTITGGIKADTVTLGINNSTINTTPSIQGNYKYGVTAFEINFYDGQVAGLSSYGAFDSPPNTPANYKVKYATAAPYQTATLTSFAPGAYVNYKLANGTTVPCRVLYNNSGNVEIITVDSLADVNYGLNDDKVTVTQAEINEVTNSGISISGYTAEQYAKAKKSYNNFVTNLNARAVEYMNTSLSSSARCVGSNPSSPNTDNPGAFASTDYTYLTTYKLNDGTFKANDTNYSTDSAQLRKIGADRTSSNSEYYWMASRRIVTSSAATFFGVRYGASDSYRPFYGVYSGGRGELGNNSAAGFRPVFNLKSTVKIVNDGKGGTSASDAYNLQ